MKNIVLMASVATILAFEIINETRAQTWNCGPKISETEYSDSVKCTLDGTILTISGSGAMANYNYIDAGENVDFHDRYSTTAPWNNENITKVVVENGVTSTGNHAFVGSKTLTTVEGMKNVTSIGARAFLDNLALEKIEMSAVRKVSYEAFMRASKLTGVELPEGRTIGADAFNGSGIESIYIPKVTTLIERALRGASKLTSVDMPSVTNIGNYALKELNLAYVGLPEGVDVSFGEDVFSEGYLIAGCSNKNRTACGSCGNDYVMSGLGCVSDCGAGYLSKEGRCIDAALGCGENYKNMGGWCNRVRYTPAEAAVAMNGYDNTITLTFRK